MTTGTIKTVFLFLVLFAGLTEYTHAMKNPAAVYCEALGYEYTVEQEDEGQRGFCVLPGDQKVDGWEFLQGKAATEFGYCSTQGLEMKTVYNPEVCMTFLAQECAVCILNDGTEVEVTRLMDLSFTDSYCGDGSCHFSEFYTTCPEDCPSGQQDGFCDEVIDGRCDADCTEDTDPDCFSTDIDADGVCNGPDSTGYPNCFYAEIEGICEPNEDLKENCAQMQSMPDCESYMYCTWNGKSCEPCFEKFDICFTVKTVDNCTEKDNCLWFGTECTLCTAGPDNCPTVYNPDQADRDRDGVGDSCDFEDNEPGSTTTTSLLDDDTPTTTSTAILQLSCPVEEIYGEEAEETVCLKRFRNTVLSKCSEGRKLIRLYYQNQSAVMQALHTDELFQTRMRNLLDRALPLIQNIMQAHDRPNMQIRKTLRSMQPLVKKAMQSDEEITQWVPRAAETILPVVETIIK